MSELRQHVNRPEGIADEALPPVIRVVEPQVRRELSEAADTNKMRGGGESGGASSTGRKCRNAFIRPHLVVDDDGYVCARNRVDLQGSQCCESRPHESLHTCKHCDEASGCCIEFEHCVSCCLSSVEKEKPLDSGDLWEACLNRCRTSSKSILNGNRYRSDLKHCYSGLDSPSYQARTGRLDLDKEGLIPPYLSTTSSILPVLSFASSYYRKENVQNPSNTPDRITLTLTLHAVRPAGISIVKASRNNENCDDACASEGKKCVQKAFEVINRCDVLQSHFPCDPCKESTGPEQPAFVIPSAGASFHPKACLFSKDPHLIRCEASHDATQRLCPCK